MEENHRVYNNIVDPNMNPMDEVLKDLDKVDRAFIKHRKLKIEEEKEMLKELLRNEIQTCSWRLQRDYLRSTNGLKVLNENNAHLKEEDAREIFDRRDASDFLEEQKRMLEQVNEEKNSWLIGRLQQIYRDVREKWTNFQIAEVDEKAADCLPHWIDRETLKRRLEDARSELNRITSIQLNLEVENNQLKDQLAHMTNAKLNVERKANERSVQHYSETENLKAELKTELKKMREHYESQKRSMEIEKVNAERKANELSVQRYSETENLKAELKKMHVHCKSQKLTIDLLTKDVVTGFMSDSDEDKMEESTAKNANPIPDHAKSSSSSRVKTTSGKKRKK